MKGLTELLPAAQLVQVPKIFFCPSEHVEITVQVAANPDSLTLPSEWNLISIVVPDD